MTDQQKMILVARRDLLDALFWIAKSTDPHMSEEEKVESAIRAINCLKSYLRDEPLGT